MYLGVDLGTSSMKLLLADGNGRITDASSAEYPLYFPRDDWAEQSPEDWLSALKACLADLGARHDLTQVKCISFCGQMHGLVALDADDNVIRPAILWNDNRTKEECRYLNEIIGREKLLEWTGNIAFTGFTAPKLMWMSKHEPENFARIAKVMLPKDYLAYKMTGVFASDVSDNSGTLYFDVRGRRWSRPMLDIIGIDESVLPAVYESSEVIGKVSAEFAEISGLSGETDVVIGGGDQAVGAVGTGTVGQGRLFISLGTSGVVFAPVSEYVSGGGGMHVFRHADKGFHIMGCTLTSAGAMKWWVDDVLHADFNEILGETDVNGRNDILFLPYLMGERSPINDPDAKGVFYNLKLSDDRADITKSLLEGICFGLKDCYEEMRRMGVEAAYARVIGGGARSDKWLQILSDVLGLELRRINTTHGAGMGAIILAMTGSGAFTSIESACDALIKDTDVFKPNKSMNSFYEEKFIRFKRLYSRLK